jgi:hypothetical protein
MRPKHPAFGCARPHWEASLQRANRVSGPSTPISHSHTREAGREALSHYSRLEAHRHSGPAARGPGARSPEPRAPSPPPPLSPAVPAPTPTPDAGSRQAVTPDAVLNYWGPLGCFVSPAGIRNRRPSRDAVPCALRSEPWPGYNHHALALCVPSASPRAKSASQTNESASQGLAAPLREAKAKGLLAVSQRHWAAIRHKG